MKHLLFASIEKSLRHEAVILVPSLEVLLGVVHAAASVRVKKRVAQRSGPLLDAATRARAARRYGYGRNEPIKKHVTRRYVPEPFLQVGGKQVDGAATGGRVEPRQPRGARRLAERIQDGGVNALLIDGSAGRIPEGA